LGVCESEKQELRLVRYVGKLSRKCNRANKIDEVQVQWAGRV